MSRRLRRSVLEQRLARHLAAGALVAAAPLAGARSADASVIHAVVNWTVPSTVSGLYIDVESRITGQLDTDVPGWDLNPYGTGSLIWFNAVGTGMMRYPGVTTGGPGCLNIGTTVGAANSYGSGTAVIGAAPGNWHLNGTNHFGFRFVASDGLVRYGWASSSSAHRLAAQTAASARSRGRRSRTGRSSWATRARLRRATTRAHRPTRPPSWARTRSR